MAHKPKTLLINPPLTGSTMAHVEMITEPLGLAYIAAMLEQNGYEVDILDALALGNEQTEGLPDGRLRIGLSEEQIAKHVSDYSPDIVGISCGFTVYVSDSHRIARCVKLAYPEAVIVFGGAHSTVVPELVLKDKNVDLVVRGEGEMTLLDVVKNIEQGKSYRHIKGTVTKDNNQEVIFNEPREFIKDLDQLPFPARHLLPMEKYFEFQKRGKLLYRYYMRKPMANIVTSRGCPYNCVFCAVRTIAGRTWRGRSAENVVAEIKLLTNEYKIKEFTPWDDNISINKDRLINICQGIIDNGLDLTWATPNGIYLPSMDEEVLSWMIKSGYYRITFGLESGSEETLKYIRKKISRQKVKEVIEICNKLGIWTNATFIIGFPNEQIDSIRATMRAPIEYGLDYANFFMAQPYEGTDLYRDFEKEGLLGGGIREGSSTLNSSYDTNYFTSEELAKLRDEAYKKLISHRILSALNPKNYGLLYRKINTRRKFVYFLRLVSNVILGIRIGHRPR